MLTLKKINNEPNNQNSDLSVSQLNAEIGKTLAGMYSNGVKVFGEISSWNKHTSGHKYFTLKDESSQIKCVMWKDKSLSSDIQEGSKVIVSANIRVYSPRGEYQLDCLSIEIIGIGGLFLQYEKLKSRLLSEGLFDNNLKKDIPLYPNRIGVITSINGAAFHDILTTLSRRMPVVDVVIRPTLVQGIGAKEDIVNAIIDFNKLKNVDVIILGRGGGSVEDLWAFNEELVARAIYDSEIPIISAIGHEVDFTIADFVSDLRAATPTAAAELAVRSVEDLNSRINFYYKSLNKNIFKKIEIERIRINNLINSYGIIRVSDHLSNNIQKIDELIIELDNKVNLIFEKFNIKIFNLINSLNILNPENVLIRGYAILQKENEIVSSTSELEKGDIVLITLQDGIISSEIK
ncbi:MAG: exodeoxyribonuclease VII large subunit [Chlorobiota bacterium]|nr:exodeoxyribonuclease VII large subunit [Chlorobiota bacterium]QQS66925.1 MAG: exodeoxyribonuclease VII large subunit [Chlorobiota bacterium]